MTKAEKALLLGSGQWKIISDMLLQSTVKGAEAKIMVELIEKVDENFTATVQRESLEHTEEKE
tara:strand:+ start:54 stop:242 length:189 start_codon:yes stop_codon:yes gene_type:complete